MTSTRVDFLSKLPPELSLHIISFIPSISTGKVALCCCLYNSLVCDQIEWKKRIAKDFPYLCESNIALGGYSKGLCCDNKDFSSFTVPDVSWKTLYAFLHHQEFSSPRCDQIGSSLCSLAIRLADTALLHFLLCRPFALSPREQNEISRRFPKEFPSIKVGKNCNLPIESKSLSVGGSVAGLDRDESILLFLNQNKIDCLTNLKYLMLSMVDSDIFQRLLACKGMERSSEVIFEAVDFPVFQRLSQFHRLTSLSLRQCECILHNDDEHDDDDFEIALESLEVSHSWDFDDTMSTALRAHLALTSLRCLFLTFCHLIEIPKWIELCRNLEEVSFESNSISSISRSLTHCTKLRTLNLSGNKISPSSPSSPSLECLLELEEVDLSYNSLVQIPSGIALLPRLRSLNLSNNLLESFPGCLLELSRIGSGGCVISLAGNPMI